MIYAAHGENVAALGAFLAGAAAFLTAWAAVKSSKTKASRECHEKLHALLVESNRTAEELHRYRVTELTGNEQHRSD
jgi:hypothetical protein